MVSVTRFPARVHALLARDKPLGVVIRRGPSKRVCTLLWDRRSDQFQIGQWLNGKIYERRSDLSPDGKHLIYFAMNGRWHTQARGSWTAISKAPYLKAVAMFPKGDCWNGGGLFTSNTSYWLNDGHGHAEMHNTHEVQRDREYRPSMWFGGECPGVYYLRLMRDGWQYIERQHINDRKDIDVFEKPLREGWIMRKFAHGELGAPVGKGCYWDEHELIRPASDITIECPAWEWAELDRKRLVWATGGKLYAGYLRAKGVVDEHELYDFNNLTFERIEAPY